jgi:hypothetical protein
MKGHILPSLVLCAALVAARDAGAQTTAWGNNGYVSLNGLYQSTPISFRTDTKLDVNQETGDVRTDHRITPGPVYDITAGGRIKGRLGVGYALSYRQKTEFAQISASVPHPLYFNQPRLVDGEAGLKRQDLAMHVSAMWLVPVTEAVQVSIFGGPTLFRVAQDMVHSVDVTEAYPFDQAVYSGVTASTEHASRIGYNAGADVAVFFTQTLGIGGLVRFSQGTVNMRSPDGGIASLKVGGLQTGAGVRVRF